MLLQLQRVTYIITIISFACQIVYASKIFSNYQKLLLGYGMFLVANARFWSLWPWKATPDARVFVYEDSI